MGLESLKMMRGFRESFLRAASKVTSTRAGRNGWYWTLSEFPSFRAGTRMALSECAENGTVDETIVAAVRNDSSKAWLDAALVAKRFDLTKRTFSELSVSHVRCRNVGIG